MPSFPAVPTPTSTAPLCPPQPHPRSITTPPVHWLWDLFVGFGALAAHAASAPLPLADLRVRDPFILADAASRTYFLYRSMANASGHASPKRGVEVFTSTDLANWSGPTPVFTVPADFWARSAVWAPEVHAYRGKYYLFTTFTAAPLPPGGPVSATPTQRPRDTQILVSDSPRGPFTPFAGRASASNATPSASPFPRAARSPVRGGKERAQLFPFDDSGDTLRLTVGHTQLPPASRTLVEQADKALRVTPPSVTHKTIIAPSGDPRYEEILAAIGGDNSQ